MGSRRQRRQRMESVPLWWAIPFTLIHCTTTFNRGFVKRAGGQSSMATGWWGIWRRSSRRTTSCEGMWIGRVPPLPLSLLSLSPYVSLSLFLSLSLSLSLSFTHTHTHTLPTPRYVDGEAPTDSAAAFDDMIEVYLRLETRIRKRLPALLRSLDSS